MFTNICSYVLPYHRLRPGQPSKHLWSIMIKGLLKSLHKEDFLVVEYFSYTSDSYCGKSTLCTHCEWFSMISLPSVSLFRVQRCGINHFIQQGRVMAVVAQCVHDSQVYLHSSRCAYFHLNSLQCMPCLLLGGANRNVNLKISVCLWGVKAILILNREQDQHCMILIFGKV